MVGLHALGRVGLDVIVDTRDRAQDEFLRRNHFGWEWKVEGGPAKPVAGNAALAAVRQIAYEVEETLRPLVAQTSFVRVGSPPAV